MANFKLPILLATLLLNVVIGYASCISICQTDKVPITVIAGTQHSGDNKSSSISASIDSHTLTVVFTENLGQVSIEVSYASGNEVETTSIYTPSGVIIYIPYSGSYVVTFTLSNGDEYYGEFEVTE